MTESVKNFIETNYSLLDNDPIEFCHTAHNGLSRSQQKELMDILKESNINIDSAVEAFARFYIVMTMGIVERPVLLRVLISQYFNGVLGLDSDWFFQFILDNEQEWDNKIELVNGSYKVFPVVDSL